MIKKPTKQQRERQQQPLPQTTLASVTELTDADLEEALSHVTGGALEVYIKVDGLKSSQVKGRG